MEEWQKNHLLTNRAKLVAETMCNELIFSHLISQRVLAKVDVERIKRKNVRYERAAALYDTLETRTNGYVAMAEALAKGNQSGPLGVFLEGFAQYVIPDVNVTFLGKTLHLTDVFDAAEMKTILNEMKQHLTLEQFVSLYDKSKHTMEPIKLIRDTIPEQISCYVPRSLSRRVNVNPEVYKMKCSDVFVFQGIGWSELKQLVQPERVENSSNQLLSLSTRFIILDQVEDWEEISKSSRVPVHMIKYEKENGERYILEATTGGSTIIHRFLEFQLNPNDQNESLSIYEDLFIEEVSRDGASGVCICDLPGMGKSLLLANLARQMKHEHPEKIVVFIQLSHFLAFVVAKNGKNVTYIRDGSLVKKILLEYMTRSSLEYFILIEMLNKTSTQLELFFDGFDEIQLGHVEVAKQLLTTASRLPNTRIFVTSRPNLRHELEASLHVISYDILPFSNANQINFLCTFWYGLSRTCKMEKLKAFAEFCVEKLKKSLKEKEESITGIPLQCRLVAEVFSRNALLFAHPSRNVSAQELCKIESSLFDLYTRYFDLRFGKLGTRFSHAVSTKLILFSAAEEATRLMVAVIGGNVCSSEIQEVKKFHVLQALKLLFPENGKIISQLFMEDTVTPLLSSVLSVGILELHFTEVGQQSFQFIHKTFAEYLAAKFFTQLLSAETGESNLASQKTKLFYNPQQVALNKNSPEEQLIQFFFKEVMKAKEMNLKGNKFCYFEHPVIMEFLNSAWATSVFRFTDDLVCKLFAKMVSENQPFDLLEATITQNHENIFIILKQLLSTKYCNFLRSWRTGVVRYSDRVLRLLHIAAKTCSLFIVQQLFQLLQDSFKIDLDGEHNPLLCKSEEYPNPLTTAVKRLDYEIVQFFVERIPIKGENLLESCVESSFSMTSMQAGKLCGILNLLVDCNKSLISEHPQVLLSVEIHVDVMKWLLRAGVDPRVASKMKTLVHKAADYMSGEDFLELYRYIVESFGGIDLFDEQKGKWRSPLPEILANHQILEFYILKIYNLPWLIAVDNETLTETLPNPRRIIASINYTDENGCTLFMCAGKGGRNVTTIRRMIEMGADVMKKDAFGNTFAHYIAKSYSANEYHEIVQLLICKQFGEIFQKVNTIGSTPLHEAIECMELLPSTLDLLVGRLKSENDPACNCYVDLNALSYFGKSILCKAVEKKRSLTFVKYLVEIGADWSIKNKYNVNLAHASAISGLVNHLKYFVELGCDINEVDEYGNNALHSVIYSRPKNTLEIVQYLVNNGIQKSKNRAGKTAFMIADEKGLKDERILKLLK